MLKVRWWRKVPLAFILTTFLLFAAFLVAAITGIERSVIVEAETSRLSLTFDGPGNAWGFRRVTLCRYDGPPPRGTPADPHSICPAYTAYSAEPDTREFWTIDWPEGSGANVDIRSDGTLVITIEHAASDAGGKAIAPEGLSPRSILIVAPKDWSAHGALTFEATATIGESMRPGLANYLHSGRWEFRQSSLATSLFRSSTELVKEGTLARGAAVTVNEEAVIAERGTFLAFSRPGDPEPAQMFGHISPLDEPGGPPAFAVFAISEPGLTELEITYFGLRDASLVKPDIIDLAIASPIFIAAITFLTLLAAVTQVLGDLVFRGESGRREEGGATGAEEAEIEVVCDDAAKVETPDVETAIPPAPPAQAGAADGNEGVGRSHGD